MTGAGSVSQSAAGGGSSADEAVIGCDAHKKYSVFVAMNALGERLHSFTADGSLHWTHLELLPPKSQLARSGSTIFIRK